MNTLGDAIFSDVAADSNLTAVLGTSPTRLAPMCAPATWSEDLYGVYVIQSHEFDHSLRQNIGIATATVRFDFYKRMAADETAPGYRATRAVPALFLTAYDGYIGTLGSGVTVNCRWMSPTDMGEGYDPPTDGEEFGTFGAFIIFDITYDVSIPYS